MNQVTVTFLGSGDTFGSGGRFQTCIQVETGTTRFLLDCGASSLIAMKRSGVDPIAIDTILISHLHGDHFGGLPFFLLEAQLISKRARPLTLAGPPGLAERLARAREVLFPNSTQTPLEFHLNLIELVENEPASLGELVVTPYPVPHASGAPAYALRVACASKVIAYSGDTEWTPVLPQVARGADLFICEAYFFDKAVKHHLNYQTLLAHRAELDCRRLILTHASEPLLARVYQLELEIARDGQRIEL